MQLCGFSEGKSLQCQALLQLLLLLPPSFKKVSLNPHGGQMGSTLLAMHEVYEIWVMPTECRPLSSASLVGVVLEWHL